MPTIGREEAPAARGPVRPSERELAPDLARGAMLLFIGLANAAGVVFGGPGFEPAPKGLERAANLLMFTFVHCRAYPVFAVMFGYGLVQLARRQESAGASPAVARSVLLRRNTWLAVFGVLHAALLYYGDFLGAYGLVGIVATIALLRRSDRVQRVVLWLWAGSAVHTLVLAALLTRRVAHGSTQEGAIPFDQVPSLVAPDYATSVLERLIEWPAHTASVLPFIVIVWLGMWAARQRFLEEPAGHRRLLKWVAVAGLGTAVVGALPLGLVSAGLLRADTSGVRLMFVLHQVSGTFAGPGYVALFGLGALSLAREGRSAVSSLAGPLAALGQRSLSGYLFQSLAWLVLLAPYTLALGRRFGSPMLTALGVALLVWLASVAGAVLLERRRKRGPAEFALRRLVYGNRSPVRTPEARLGGNVGEER
jgi:uncharacterized membrane protein YeiB